MRITGHLIVIVLLALAACVIAEDAEKEEWVSLFNGKDLTGWVQKGGKAKYRVEKGEIVGSSVLKTPNSFLCTEKSYRDFVLEFEFKGNAKLNSGVQIRSESKPEYKKGRVHGYQCELEDEDRGRAWSGGIYDEGRRGWLYPGKKGGDEKTFGEQGKKTWKKGEWNHVRIEAKGDAIKTWINGELRTDMKDDMTASGFIGLQVHGTKTAGLEVRWRNLRIQEL